MDKVTIQKIFKTYLGSIQSALQKGDAGEQTHYSALKTLIESLFPGITATITPKGIQDAAKESIKPDFRITRGDIPLGHIEAKDVGADLNAAQRSEQLKRYFGALPSVMLTNFLEFRWYIDGELKECSDFALGGPDDKLKTGTDRMEKTLALLTAFLEHRYPSVGTPQELAERMARLAHLCRETIVETFTREVELGSLHTQLEAFRENLIPGLTSEQFADMYAQTIAYGLFAARCECENPEKFSRKEAAYLIPKTNPFLRKFFEHVAGPDLDTRIEWVVEDLVELLRRADMAEVLRDFGKRTRKEDPVVHFYETFLKAYDPKVREMRGVYYTPLPVVNYIVRAIDETLKTDFKRPQGLADPTVYILDPACGTSTFLYEVVRHIHDYIQEQGQGGTWDGYVEKYLLPRLFGFELLMAPYAIAHLKLALLLKSLGYAFKSDERLNIFLTNTLEEAMKKSQTLFAKFISDEANSAAAIKEKLPIMVVLGNPPYSGHSANRSYYVRNVKKGQDYLKKVNGKWVMVEADRDIDIEQPTFIGRLIDDYKFVDGAPLGERNPKWLQDDYVKFIRFAQWRITKTGHGIVGYITNHSYLDNPTFRGMRQSLMETFDKIDIINLHGNAKKKEVCPDGSKDENVFDIQQGVAIGIFAKTDVKTAKRRVRQADIWGTRDAKQKTLLALSPKSRVLETIAPKSPMYYFVPRDTTLATKYERFWKITDVMEVNSVGIVTSRDLLVLGYSQTDLNRKMKRFCDLSFSDSDIAVEFSLRGKSNWNISDVRKQLANTNWHKAITNCLYRPFDVRPLCYDDLLIERSRKNVMRHILEKENPALCVGRAGNVVGNAAWNLAFCSHHVNDFNLFYRGGNLTLPLYLYRDGEESKQNRNGVDGGNGNGYQMTIAEPRAKYGKRRRANLNPAFIKEMAAAVKMEFFEDGKGDLKKTFGPEDIFDYIYAVFLSPNYRKRYAEFLKSDFPRVPLPEDAKQFRRLTSLGGELVALHLMESPKLDKLITKYDTRGVHHVEQVRYVDTQKRVYINKEQFFEGMPKDVWEFQIGGYQVCEKWLKDRKGRELGVDEIKHYQRIVVALNETIRLMKEIDEVGLPGLTE